MSAYEGAMTRSMNRKIQQGRVVTPKTTREIVNMRFGVANSDVTIPEASFEAFDHEDRGDPAHDMDALNAFLRGEENEEEESNEDDSEAVSYTHLTLPTIYSV